MCKLENSVMEKFCLNSLKKQVSDIMIERERRNEKIMDTVFSVYYAFIGL